MGTGGWETKIGPFKIDNTFPGISQLALLTTNKVHVCSPDKVHVCSPYIANEETVT